MLFRPLTLQEANAVIPLVQEKFESIHSLIAEIQSLTEEERKENEKKKKRPNRDEGVAKRVKDRAFRRELIKQTDLLIKTKIYSLQLYGAIVRSVTPAKVEFLAQRNHQLVFLGWQMGDEEISYYRPAIEGHSTRRLVEEKAPFGPSFVH